MSPVPPLAVITGGASGIGAAVARHFAADGWRVIVTDISAAQGEALAEAGRAAGRWLRFVRLDVTDEAAVADCARRIEAEHGPPAALVNSAGLLQGAVRTADMPLAAFDAILAVNLKGALLCSRAFGAGMRAAGRGAVVNIASIAALRPGPQPAYAMSKAGLVTLTGILAAEYGPSGVRVNAVAPGYTLTPLMQDLIARGERDPEAVIRASALGRFVAPEEVAEAIAFLCSDRARAITGVLLPVDCGWLAGTAYAAWATQPE